MKIQKFLVLLLIFLFFSSQAFAKFSFVVFGDNRNGEAVFKDLITKINQEPDVSFAINTGDLTSDGFSWQFHKYLGMIGECKVKVYNVIGNHDIGHNGRRAFERIIGDRIYSWDFESSHFVVLDNVSEREIGREQFNWLEKDLSKARGKSIFIFIHIPIYDLTHSHPNSVMPFWEGRALLNLLSRYRVRYVFSGHIHGYARGKQDSIIHIITAGAGAPLYLKASEGGFYHYIKVTVDGSRIKDEVVKLY